MRLLRLLVIFGFCLVAVTAALSVDQGKSLLYGGAGQGHVIFDGRVHAAKGFTCNDCHLRLFTTHKRALITMDDHYSDRACFACHNGDKAFNDCEKCHRKVEAH